MMDRNRFLKVLAALAFCAQAGWGLDFDQGVSVEACITDIRKQAAENPNIQKIVGNVRPIYLLSIEKGRIPISRLKVPPGCTIQGCYGPWTPSIVGSIAYRQLMTLRQDPRYEALSPSVLQPMNREWNTINEIKGGLLLQAESLEGRDRTLYEKAVGLDLRRAELLQRKDQLDADIDQWNSDCATHPLPPDEYSSCLHRREELLRRKALLAADIVQFNDDVAVWNDESGEIKQEADGLVSIINTWALRMSQLIDNIINAFQYPEQGEMCELVEPPQGGVCVYSCPSGAGVALDPPVPGNTDTCPKQIYHIIHPPSIIQKGRGL